jgi:hypothetical protein
MFVSAKKKAHEIKKPFVPNHLIARIACRKVIPTKKKTVACIKAQKFKNPHPILTSRNEGEVKDVKMQITLTCKSE